MADQQLSLGCLLQKSEAVQQDAAWNVLARPSSQSVCRREDNKCVRYGNGNDVIAVKCASAPNDEADIEDGATATPLFWRLESCQRCCFPEI